ncbi:MAG TPA: choice-of-anchor D domain-containing protein, partial [Gaiellaceae bacterium]|nr:choice-of-anchor D domain-containing protein [Gaiellaceae bacterium]
MRPQRGRRFGSHSWWLALALAIACVLLAPGGRAQGATPGDATMAGDNLRTGWYPDQPSLSPQVVSGGTFGQIFSTTVQGQVYAQPVVAQNTLLVATEANWIYGLDPVNGGTRWSRNLGQPFDPTDVSCGDLSPTVGVTGTPVVDGATGTEYLFAKVYDGPGKTNVNWYLHAVDVQTGVERAGFPVKITGTAQNNPSIAFNAKFELQRPGLLLLDGVVYAAFGGHCDRLPYWGWVVGVSTQGQIKAMWATPSTSGNGGGIWQSGGGIVSDGPGQLLVVTGNGMGGGTPPSPTPGKSPPGNLAQSVVRLGVRGDGSLAATDFFAPYDAAFLDTTDADLGSGGPVELPAPYFGTPQTPHLMVQVGKAGYVFILDADNLGGMAQGPNGSDLVVNRFGPLPNGLWAKPAVWPGDGGWVYMAFRDGLKSFKYGLDGNGRPTLTQRTATNEVFAFGSSAGVVTSDGTTSGSALLWAIYCPNDGTGTNAQLRAYDTVPVGTSLRLRFSAPIGTASKFALPGVANGRIYVGTRDGHVIGFGVPATVPLTGQSVAFPNTIVGNTSNATATLTATGPVTIQSVSTTGAGFASGAPTPSLPATLTNGQSLSVPVSFTPTQGGTAGGTLVVTTSAGTASIGLSGSGIAAGAQLTVSPLTLSLGGVVVGRQRTDTVTFSNTGGSPLTITGVTQPAAPFSLSGAPAIGSALAPGASVVVSVTFSPTQSGLFTSDFAITTTAGTGDVNVSGNATDPGALSISTSSLDYGTVDLGTTVNRSFTVTNSGPGAVTITKSKPPSGGTFTATTSLAEGTIIPAGTTLTETVAFRPLAGGPASDEWDITGDDGSGAHVVSFTGTGNGSSVTVNARPGDDGDVTVNNMAVPGAAYPPAGTPNPADKTQNLGVRRAFA